MVVMMYVLHIIHYEGCISDLHLYVNVKVLPNSFTINRHWGTWEEYYSEEF